MERIIKPETLKAELAGKYVLDVRRVADHHASSEQLAGAHWKDPEKLETWAESLPQDQEIVLYCVRGGGVSNSVVDALQAKGLKARFIEGGIEGWKTAGGAVVGK
ncbi:MAG: rhodanese-like domain-containing protein [Pseudomonadota bacterium]|nr:rhodanese-like domain-containing protein [Pseudomonadota bacterium]